MSTYLRVLDHLDDYHQCAILDLVTRHRPFKIKISNSGFSWSWATFRSGGSGALAASLPSSWRRTRQSHHGRCSMEWFQYHSKSNTTPWLLSFHSTAAIHFLSQTVNSSSFPSQLISIPADAAFASAMQLSNICLAPSSSKS